MHARPRRTDGQTDEYDGKALRFVLTNASRTKKYLNIRITAGTLVLCLNTDVLDAAQLLLSSCCGKLFSTVVDEYMPLKVEYSRNGEQRAFLLDISNDIAKYLSSRFVKYDWKILLVHMSTYSVLLQFRLVRCGKSHALLFVFVAYA